MAWCKMLLLLMLGLQQHQHLKCLLFLWVHISWLYLAFILYPFLIFNMRTRKILYHPCSPNPHPWCWPCPGWWLTLHSGAVAGAGRCRDWGCSLSLRRTPSPSWDWVVWAEFDHMVLGWWCCTCTSQHINLCSMKHTVLAYIMTEMVVITRNKHLISSQHLLL